MTRAGSRDRGEGDAECHQDSGRVTPSAIKVAIAANPIPVNRSVFMRGMKLKKWATTRPISSATVAVSLALVGSALAFVLVRSRDFVSSTEPAPEVSAPEPVGVGAGVG